MQPDPDEWFDLTDREAMKRFDALVETLPVLSLEARRALKMEKRPPRLRLVRDEDAQ